jgi:hypothetical protein
MLHGEVCIVVMQAQLNGQNLCYLRICCKQVANASNAMNFLIMNDCAYLSAAGDKAEFMYSVFAVDKELQFNSSWYQTCSE